MVAAHPRTKQGGMGYAALAQGVLVLPKMVKNLLPVYGSYLARNWPDLQLGGEGNPPMQRISVQYADAFASSTDFARRRANQ
jgi:hypothetical protein